MTASSQTDLVVIPSTNVYAPYFGQPTSLPNFKIVFGSQEASNTVALPFTAFTKSVIELLLARKSETLLVEAVRNFIRKTNFAELNEALNEGDINEDDFNAELEKNAEKYAITLKNISFPEEALLIADLVNKIGYDLREITSSEVSEMFSVKEDQLISRLKALKYQVK